MQPWLKTLRVDSSTLAALTKLARGNPTVRALIAEAIDKRQGELTEGEKTTIQEWLSKVNPQLI